MSQYLALNVLALRIHVHANGFLPRNTTRFIEPERETSRVKVKLQYMCIQNMDMSHKCHEMSHVSQSLTLF